MSISFWNVYAYSNIHIHYQKKKKKFVTEANLSQSLVYVTDTNPLHAYHNKLDTKKQP